MSPYRLFRGKSGNYFLENTSTKKQESLRTRDREEANQLLFVKLEAAKLPAINLQIARAHPPFFAL